MRLCKPDIARLPEATPMDAIIPHDVMGANEFHSGFLSCMCGKDKFTAAQPSAASFQCNRAAGKVKHLLTLFYPPLHRMVINTDDIFC